MTFLDKYLEQIEVAGESLKGEAFNAYRMDDGNNKSNDDMKTEIGLGTCHSCDYFKIRTRNQKEVVVLIEETRLMTTFKAYKKECDAIVVDKERKDKFVERRIRDENILKVYGSLFTLCHGAKKCPELSDLVAGKKHDFWLVASDSNEHDAPVAGYMADRIRQELRGLLNKDLIGDIKLLTTSQLKSVLSEDAAPP